MKPASCPTHGREHLANAGAPNIVRCNAPTGCATGVLEPHRACRGEGCEDCDRRGWVTRSSRVGSAYVTI